MFASVREVFGDMSKELTGAQIEKFLIKGLDNPAKSFYDVNNINVILNISRRAYICCSLRYLIFRRIANDSETERKQDREIG